MASKKGKDNLVFSIVNLCILGGEPFDFPFAICSQHQRNRFMPGLLYFLHLCASIGRIEKLSSEGKWPCHQILIEWVGRKSTRVGNGNVGVQPQVFIKEVLN